MSTRERFQPQPRSHDGPKTGRNVHVCVCVRVHAYIPKYVYIHKYILEGPFSVYIHMCMYTYIGNMYVYVYRQNAFSNTQL